jgi:hypothetical protein
VTQEAMRVPGRSRHSRKTQRQLAREQEDLEAARVNAEIAAQQLTASVLQQPQSPSAWQQQVNKLGTRPDYLADALEEMLTRGYQKGADGEA